jgi:hypothetical protein
MAMCFADEMCPDPMVCISGQCVPPGTMVPCHTDDDCIGQGGTCTNGTCGPQCQTNADCTAPATCQSGQCVTSQGCTLDSDCMPGQVCTNGACTDQGSGCVHNSDCSSGQLCVDAVCTNAPACTSDVDCSSGQLCNNGQCVADGVNKGGCAVVVPRHDSMASGLVMALLLLGCALSVRRRGRRSRS